MEVKEKESNAFYWWRLYLSSECLIRNHPDFSHQGVAGVWKFCFNYIPFMIGG